MDITLDICNVHFRSQPLLFFMKKKGMFDYIADIVTPEEKENGIRVDIEFNYPKTVVTKTIRFENESLLLKHIAMLTVIK